MLEIYTNLFNYLSTHTPSIKPALGKNADEFANLLRAPTVFSKLKNGDLENLGTSYENFLRKLFRYGLGVPELELYFSEFLEGQGMLKETSKGVSITLKPKPTKIEMTSEAVEEIRKSLRLSTQLADILTAKPTMREDDDLFTTESESMDQGAGGESDGQRGVWAPRPRRTPSDWKKAKPPMPSQPPPPAAAPAEAMAEAPEAPQKTGREIIVTGHDAAGRQVEKFVDREAYTLKFRVGSPVQGNLANGNVGINDIPAGGMQTRWVVASSGVEILNVANGTCQKVGEVWRAEFDFPIPESGESGTVEMRVRPVQSSRTLAVVIYDIRKGEKQIYREFVVDLESRVAVGQDSECVAPRHLHLETTHEWTTPTEHIQIAIIQDMVKLTTNRGPNDYDVNEAWTGTDNRIAAPIRNVQNALDMFSETWAAYLNAIDIADMRSRLFQQNMWQPPGDETSWESLPDVAPPQHRSVFDQVKTSLELRNLASAGYSLYQSCFPQNSEIRKIIEALPPGSRIDFSWTESSGAGYVSHVPWPLMYMDPPDPLGEQPIDCKRFFGLRFRIASRSHSQKASSLALGSPDSIHSVHLLYWGNNPADPVGVESRWQAAEYRNWKQQIFVPEPLPEDSKRQVIRALDSPAPAPVGVLYMYCHCSVGDGSQPVLRFGNTSQPQDTLKESELSQRNLSDAPLIFANACTTAASDPHLTGVLEETFFQRGVRAFIGTETKVPIQLGSRFAWLFFQFFYRQVDPAPMGAGEALTQARIFLWTQYRNIGGLFYGLVNQYDLFLASTDEVESLRR